MTQYTNAAFYEGEHGGSGLGTKVPPCSQLLRELDEDERKLNAMATDYALKKAVLAMRKARGAASREFLAALGVICIIPEVRQP